MDDLVELARIPAPTFAEEARIGWIEQRLAKSPGVRARDRVGNLVWRWGDGTPRLLLAAHVDTVFGPDVPITVRRDGAELVGPGVGDNAAAVAVAIDVVEDVLSRTALAPGAVAFTVCEEGLGNLRGAAAACETLRPDAFVALEGHLLDRVLVDAVGSVRARVSVRGPGGHPWVDRGRPSALHALLELGAAFSGREHGAAVVNVGLVSGGRSVNSIADEAELTLEARSVDEAALDGILAELERLELQPPLEISVDIVGRRPGGQLSRDAELLRLVREIRLGLGLPDVLDAGSTDANAALARGIPSLALGVGHGREMHTSSERIDVESLELGRAQVERLVLRLLAPAQDH